MVVELMPHQQKAVDELSNGKILRGDPGAGKTFAALAYFYTKECGGTLNDWGSIKTPKDVYIITTAKKRNDGDWQSDALKLGLSELPPNSVAGIKVTVDSWNSIEKYEDVENAFFIFDEQKAIGSGVWAKTFIKIAKKNRWIVLTATPGDVWMDYIPVFVANGFYKNRTEFVREHVIYATWVKFPKVESYKHVGRLVRYRNAILVEMPFARHTTRILSWLNVDWDEELLDKVTKQRWNVYESKPLRDVAELFSVSRKVVNSDSSRLQRIIELQKKHKRLIVFYNFDYELEILRTLDPNVPQWSMGIGGSSETDFGEVSASKTSTTSSESSSTPSKRHICAAMPKASALRWSDPDVEVDVSTLPRPPKGLNDTSRDLKKIAAREKLASLSEKSQMRFIEDRTGADLSKTPSASTYQEERDAEKAVKIWLEATSILRSNAHISKSTESRSSSDGRLLESTSMTHPQRSFTVAEWNGHKHQPVPTTDEWVYLVQYRAGAEAWNCTTTDAMAFYSMTYSYKDFEQSQGRIDRINTPFTDLYYYVLASDAWIDNAIQKSLNAKQDFNEKRYEKNEALAHDIMNNAEQYFRLRDEEEAA